MEHRPNFCCLLQQRISDEVCASHLLGGNCLVTALLWRPPLLSSFAKVCAIVSVHGIIGIVLKGRAGCDRRHWLIPHGPGSELRGIAQRWVQKLRENHPSSSSSLDISGARRILGKLSTPARLQFLSLFENCFTKSCGGTTPSVARSWWKFRSSCGFEWKRYLFQGTSFETFLHFHEISAKGLGFCPWVLAQDFSLKWSR